MEKIFMINFKFDGRQVYANVFEQKHSPAVYHVHFIDHIIPKKIILYEQNGRIEADPEDGVNPNLVELVIAEIEKNPNRI